MLSILIPTYNYNITKLVSELHRQALEATIDFEIIIMEDGSNTFLEENKATADLDFCRYIVLEKNIGRSAIRNKLADTAKYEQLIFMDCDAEVSSPDYIQRYAVFFHGEYVVLGGRIYAENIAPQYSLLSKYGKQRERNNADNLKKRKHRQIFTSPNFLISKSIFNRVRFDESIKGYGHEDTIFGIMLQRENVKFEYIDNPVIHIGIENNQTFVKKTEEALRNLYSLYNSGEYPELEKESKILSFYLKLDKEHLTCIVSVGYKIFDSLIKKNLLSARPSLFLFDFYKFAYLCNLEK